MLGIAKILKAWGNEGDVMVSAVTPSTDLQELDPKEPVFIEFDGLPVPFFIEKSVRKGNSRAIWHLCGVDSLRDAEEICGKMVSADTGEDAEDEEDFSGWTLQDKGTEVGVIEGIEDIPGNPCLLMGGRLIPFHEDLVLDVDPEARILNMDLPAGL